MEDDKTQQSQTVFQNIHDYLKATEKGMPGKHEMERYNVLTRVEKDGDISIVGLRASHRMNC